MAEDKVEKYSKRIGVRVKRIAIKNLRNRWGSLTKKGVVNLNLNLIKAPEYVIDYIILHELSHLKNIHIITGTCFLSAGLISIVYIRNIVYIDFLHWFSVTYPKHLKRIITVSIY